MAEIKGSVSGIAVDVEPTSRGLKEVAFDSEGKEHSPPNSVCPRFLANSGVLAIAATAHGGTAGWFWLINPIGNSKWGRLRRLEVQTQHSSALITLTVPRISFEVVTFTGSASGAQITPMRTEPENAPSLLLITASTGLSLTAGAVAWCALPTMAMTAVGIGVPTMLEYEPSPEAMIILKPGYGIVCRQADAGTASDTRKAIVNLGWEEFTP